MTSALRFVLVASIMVAATLHSGTRYKALAETARQSLNEADINDGAKLTMSGNVNIQVFRGEDDLSDCLLFAVGASEARADSYSDDEYFKLVTTVFDSILETWRFDKLSSFKAACVLIFTADQQLYGYFAKIPLDAVKSVDGRAFDATDLALAKTGKMVLLKEVYKQATFFRDKTWHDDVKAKFAKYLDDAYVNLTETFFEMARREAQEKTAAGKDPNAPPPPGQRGVDSRLDDPKLAAPVTETVGGCTFNYPHRIWQLDFDILNSTLRLQGVEGAKQSILQLVCRAQPSGTFQMVDAVPDDGPDSFDEFASPKEGFHLMKFDHQGCVFDVEFGITGDEFFMESKFAKQCPSATASASASSSGLQNIIFVDCEVTDSMVAPTTMLDIEKRDTGIIIDVWSRGVQMTRVSNRPDWPSSFNYTCSFGEGAKRKACSGTLTLSGTKKHIQIRVPSSCSRSFVQEW